MTTQMRTVTLYLTVWYRFTICVWCVSFLHCLLGTMQSTISNTSSLPSTHSTPQFIIQPRAHWQQYLPSLRCLYLLHSTHSGQCCPPPPCLPLPPSPWQHPACMSRRRFRRHARSPSCAAPNSPCTLPKRPSDSVHFFPLSPLLSSRHVYDCVCTEYVSVLVLVCV